MPTATSDRPSRHGLRLIEKLIGTNDADNEIATTAVVANADGSLLERVEYVQSQATSVLAGQIAPASPATFFPGLGYHITKTGVSVASTLASIFTISGKVLVTYMVGQTTSVFATTTSLQLVTSVGSRVLCASTDVVTEIANTLYIVTGDPDDVLSATTQNTVGLAMNKSGVWAPFVLQDNVIQQKVDGAGTGLVTWDMYYIPISASAAASAS